MNNSIRHSRLLIPGIFLLGACMRTPITSIPSIVKEIAQSFNIPETSLGILTTIPLLCFGLFSVVIPALSRRWGNEVTIAVSLALLTIGSWLRIFNYSMLIWGTILVGVAITFINVLLPALITDNLPSRVGSMTSLYNVALSLFSAIGAYVSTLLSQFSACSRWSPCSCGCLTYVLTTEIGKQLPKGPICGKIPVPGPCWSTLAPPLLSFTLS